MDKEGASVQRWILGYRRSISFARFSYPLLRAYAINEIRQRYLREPVEEDLKSHMVFIGGPRQVGKTVFALGFLSPPEIRHPAYLNWDDVQVRSVLMKGELPAGQTVVILDEIHKFARWRSLVKGFYDTRKTETAFIITGSARLDHYRKRGDSLHGRYHFYRLHPFSPTELNATPQPRMWKTSSCSAGFRSRF